MVNRPELHSTDFLRQLQQQRDTIAAKEGKGIGKYIILVAVLVMFPFLLPLALIVGVIWLVMKKSQSEKTQGKPPVRREKKQSETRFAVSSTFVDETDGVWLSVKKQLEQAETLKEAGILSPEEYRIWKARIQNYNHA